MSSQFHILRILRLHMRRYDTQSKFMKQQELKPNLFVSSDGSLLYLGLLLLPSPKTPLKALKDPH